MTITDLTVLSALKSKMRWHQTRQRVLAENIANADTPGYRAKDLREQSFKNSLAQTGTSRSNNNSFTPIRTMRTSPAHLSGLPMQSPTGGQEIKAEDFEVTPQGNGVVLEDQMIKLADNQMDYEAAANLYKRGLSLIKTAISRR
jgi:flagellar basal-body rod protein FlgB